MPISAEELTVRCRAIELLLLDVDGVLTDGVIAVNDAGAEHKHFFVRDGQGVALWRRAGKRAAILSGRSAACVAHRAAELGIDPVIQGASEKTTAFQEMLDALQLAPHQVCFMGDDWPDLPLLGAVGVAACPADAIPEVREAAHLVTHAAGGRGAVREVIEQLLRRQGVWGSLVRAYAQPAVPSPSVRALG